MSIQIHDQLKSHIGGDRQPAAWAVSTAAVPSRDVADGAASQGTLAGLDFLSLPEAAPRSPALRCWLEVALFAVLQLPESSVFRVIDFRVRFMSPRPAAGGRITRPSMNPLTFYASIARPGADMRKADFLHNLADMAFVMVDTKALLDDALQN